MKKYYEIIIYGRGGQGAKTCAQIIAEGAMYSGNQIQGFPEYGPERRGAPVRSFVRISDKPIRVHEPVTKPDCVIVIDPKLFDVKEELKDFDCPFIINSNEDESVFSKKTKSKEIYIIDGSSIAREEIKINNPNIVLIGGLLKLLEKQNNKHLIDYKKIENSIKDTFVKKNKKHLVKPNLNCLIRGFENLLKE